MSPQPPPGWYPDPEDPTQQKWWSGVAWTAHVAPAAGSKPRRTKPAPVRVGGKWRPGVSTWIVGIVALFFSLIEGIGSGFGAFLLTLSLFALPTAIVAVAAKRPTWMRLAVGSWPAKGALALAVVGLLVGSIVLGVAPSGNPQVSADGSSKSVSLADYTGATGPDASSRLSATGFAVKMVTDDGSPIPANWSGWTVVGESPRPGHAVAPGTTVTITLHAPAFSAAAPVAAPAPVASAPPPVPTQSAVPVHADPAPATHAAPKKPATAKKAPVVKKPAPKKPAPKKAAPKKAAPKKSAPSSHLLVVPGAFCPNADKGVVGHSSKGKSYKCGGHGADANGHLHWNTVP
jgi:hypothetical protein